MRAPQELIKVRGFQVAPAELEGHLLGHPRVADACVVGVPDERLPKLADLFSSQKTIPATVDFVDIAGIVKGASEGAGLGNKFLANIRDSDAICQVIRAFQDDDVVHVDGRVSPLARTLSSASCRPRPPLPTGYKHRITAARIPCLPPRISWSGSTLTNLASSWLRRIGCGNTICRHESGVGLSRSPSGPTVPCRLVTTSSRIASSGGLVT